MSVPKNYNEFTTSLTNDSPSLDWPDSLRAMWYDVKGDWEASHNIAQDMMNVDGSWIHAYLHRKEGDEFNAGYWYRQAKRKFPEISLKDEQCQLVTHFLDQYNIQERD